MLTLLTSTPDFLVAISVSLGVCVVLPVLIVYSVMNVRRNEMNRKAEVALKALETGAQVDPAFFAPMKKEKTTKEKLFGTVKGGLVCICVGLAFAVAGLTEFLDRGAAYGTATIIFAVGAALVASYFIGRRQFAKEIKAEEDKLGTAE